MSSSVDSRIVQMKFDNSDFEKKIQSTITSLEKLNKTLNDNLIQNEAGAFENLGKSIRNVNTDDLNTSIESTGKSFSAMEVVAVTALANISNSVVNLGKKLVSNLISPITSGGLQRALNIEQAGFQLEGLNIEKTDSNSYYTQVMDAVLGTAYSYDVAAKAASQLAASNIGVAESEKTLLNGQKKTVKYMTSDMTDAILGIAGVSSMTGSSFEDMSQIFTRVAGQGRVMSNDLNSIAARGLNVAATLADYLNETGDTATYTEEKIRDMVTKGEIDFDTFSKAMTWAFGEHAKDSTKLFTGAIEDAKAALARIGADFYEPLLTAGRDIVNSITPLVDVVHEKIQWALDATGDYAKQTAKKISGFLDLVSVSGSALRDDFGNFNSVTSTVSKGMESLRSATENTVDPVKLLTDYMNSLGDGTKYTRTQVNSMIHDGSVNISQWAAAVRMYGNSTDKYSTQVKSYLSDLNSEIMRFENIADVFGLSGGLVADGMAALIKEFPKKEADDVYKAIGEELDMSLTDVKDAFDKGTISAKDFRTALSNLQADGAITSEAFNSIMGIIDDGILKNEELNSIVERGLAIWEGLEAIFGSVKTIAGSLLRIATSFLDALAPLGSLLLDFVDTLARGSVKIADFITKTDEAIEKLGIFEAIANAVGKAANFLSDGISKLGSAIKTAISNAFGWLADIFGTINSEFTKFVQTTGNITNLLSSGGLMIVLMNLAKILNTINNPMKSLGNGLGSFFKDFASSFKAVRNNLWELSKILYAYQSQIKTNYIQKLGVALLALSAACYILSKVDAGALTKAVVAMGSLMVMLAQTAKSLVTFNTKGASSLIGVGTALAILSVSLINMAIATKILSTISIEDLISGLAGLGAILEFVYLFVSHISGMDTAGMIKAAAAMTILAVAVNLMVIPVKILGNMDFNQLVQGLVGLAAILGGLFVFAKFLSTDVNLLQVGAGMLAIAIGVGIIASAVAKLGAMSSEQLLQGMIGMAAALMMLYAVATIAQGEMAGAAAILILSAAVLTLYFALAAIGSMDPNTLVQGILGIGVALMVLGLCATALQEVLVPMLALAGVLLVISLAAIGFGVGLTLIGTGIATVAATGGMLGQFAATMGVFLGMLIAFGVAAVAVSVPLLALGVALTAFGVGALLCGTGLLLISSALTGLSAITANLPAMGIGLSTLVKPLVKLAFIGAGLLVTGAGLSLVGVGLLAIGAGAAACKKNVPKLAEAMDQLKDALSGTGAMKRNIKALGNSLDDFADALGETKNGLKTINTSIQTMSNAVRKHQKDFKDAGKYLVDGLIKGLNDRLPALATAAAKMGRTALKSAKDALKEKSPSKATFEMGQYLDQGLINGIKSLSNKVNGAASEMGESTLSAMAEAINNSVDYINDEHAPVITPVVDMSNVTSAAGSINSLLSSSQASSIYAAMSVRRSASEQFSDAIGSLGAMMAGNGSVGNTYNINGITYDDGSNVANAVGQLMRAARIEGRV